jgi:hypothetical protein
VSREAGATAVVANAPAGVVTDRRRSARARDDEDAGPAEKGRIG